MCSELFDDLRIRAKIRERRFIACARSCYSPFTSAIPDERISCPRCAIRGACLDERGFKGLYDCAVVKWSGPVPAFVSLIQRKRLTKRKPFSRRPAFKARVASRSLLHSSRSRGGILLSRPITVYRKDISSPTTALYHINFRLSIEKYRKTINFSRYTILLTPTLLYVIIVVMKVKKVQNEAYRMQSALYEI